MICCFIKIEVTFREFLVAVKKVCDDERFSKYFKMLKMGVPMQAVKNKMKAEGLDDSVLDNPDAPAADNHEVVDDDSTSGDESDSWE